NGVEPEIAQNLRPDPGLMLHRALALGVAAMRNQPAVGLHPQSRSSLMEIDQHTQALRGDLPQRARYHLLTIALRGAENVTIDAMGVHPHQHVFLPGDLAANQGQMSLRPALARVFT